MASLSLMHPKYKDELEKDVDLDFIYVLLGLAGITQVFMNFYPQRRGQFNFHRDGFQKKSDNSKPVADAKKVKTKQFVHKADLGPISFQACSLQRQRALEVNHHQVLWHGGKKPGSRPNKQLPARPQLSHVGLQSINTIHIAIEDTVQDRVEQ